MLKTNLISSNKCKGLLSMHKKMCYTGGQNRENRQGNHLGACKGISLLSGEILALQQSTGKPIKSQKNSRKKKRRTKEHILFVCSIFFSVLTSTIHQASAQRTRSTIYCSEHKTLPLIGYHFTPLTCLVNGYMRQTGYQRKKESQKEHEEKPKIPGYPRQT